MAPKLAVEVVETVGEEQGVVEEVLLLEGAAEVEGEGVMEEEIELDVEVVIVRDEVGEEGVCERTTGDSITGLEEEGVTVGDREGEAVGDWKREGRVNGLGAE